MLILNPAGSTADVENTGFYFRQTRYLRDLRLELFGEAPYACSAAEVAPNVLEFSYVYPEKRGGGSDVGGEHNGLRYEDLDIRVNYRLRPNGLDVRVRICNRWLETATLPLTWAVSADFADYGEVFGDRKQQAGIAVDSMAASVRFRYLHPALPLETVASVDGPGEWQYRDGKLGAEIVLPRQREVCFTLRVRAVDREDAISDEAAMQREERLRAWHAGVSTVEAPGEAAIARIVNRSMEDIGSLALLEGPDDEWLCPAAGVPLFGSFWARDSLTTAWQSAVFDRGRMAEAVLNATGRRQGVRDDLWRDEQPGRILRGAQRSPLARLGITPMDCYYGDYASPFAFLFALGQLYSWSGEERLLKQHFDTARRILDWARERGDLDQDGYLEYQTRSPEGPKHQGWRDAENAVVYADGRQVETPIATCELQGYWYAAQQFMAAFSVVAGSMSDARAHWRSAAELKERFNRDFWMPGERCIALGLETDKQQIGSVTSNAGQTLTTGIVTDEHLPLLIERLFAPDLFSGWGLRTLSTGNPAYNPVSYHLGSVWPVENATLLFGLRRFGFEREAQLLARSLFDLALIWRGARVPECVGGYGRAEARHPGAYPQANAPQAWNQSVFPILIQTLLGMRALAPLRLLAIYPKLPEWLPEITIRNLRVGDATVTLRFRREGQDRTTYEVLQKRGTLHIVDQPPMESLTVGIWDRLGALFQ
jgi:glycogen debranching enzyme